MSLLWQGFYRLKLTGRNGVFAMSLTKAQYVTFLIEEGKRSLIHKDPNFYKSLSIFVNSEEGRQGFIEFQRLDPSCIELPPEPNHISESIKRIFQL